MGSTRAHGGGRSLGDIPRSTYPRPQELHPQRPVAVLVVDLTESTSLLHKELGAFTFPSPLTATSSSTTTAPKEPVTKGKTHLRWEKEDEKVSGNVEKESKLEVKIQVAKEVTKEAEATVLVSQRTGLRYELPPGVKLPSKKKG